MESFRSDFGVGTAWRRAACSSGGSRQIGGERRGRGDLTRLAGGNKLATRALVPSVPLAIGAPRASVGLLLPLTRSPASSRSFFFTFYSTSARPVRRSAQPCQARSPVTELGPIAFGNSLCECW